jgi:hypothetical protein
MNPNILKSTALFSFLLVVFSISQFKGKKVVINRAVYYWKNSAVFDTDKDSVYKQFICQHKIKKVYVKMLDVDWVLKRGIVPITKTNLSEYSDGLEYLVPYKMPIDSNLAYYDRPKEKIDFVPVVFITNKAIAHLDSSNQRYLAEQILRHLFRLEKYTGQNINEYQVDCDWSETTKDKYFALIKKMKTYLPSKKVSATIRLYQYKYFKKAGVPPVDKGMLMIYNLTNATQYNSKNSIFNLPEAIKYLPINHPYPLQLSVALPMFSWGILFNNYKYKAVVNDMNTSKAKFLSFLREIRPNEFLVTCDTIYNEIPFEAGNLLKIEQCGDMELDLANFAMKRLPVTDSLEVSLFDLNAFDINNIRYESIEKAYTW